MRGELCLCSVDIYQASTVDEVAAEVDKKWDYILASLTSNGDKLKELAHIDFKMDKVAPAKDGLLPFAPEYDADKSMEPGAYMEEVMDYFNAEHICDGLPIIPPTKRRYEAMLEYCPWDEDTKLVDPSGPSGREITVKRRCHRRCYGRLQAPCNARARCRLQGASTARSTTSTSPSPPRTPAETCASSPAPSPSR